MDQAPSVHVISWARILEWKFYPLPGLRFPSPGNLPDPRIKSVSPVLQLNSLTLGHLGSPNCVWGSDKLVMVKTSISPQVKVEWEMALCQELASWPQLVWLRQLIKQLNKLSSPAWTVYPVDHSHNSSEVTQSYPTLCNPMDCSQKLLCLWAFPGKNTGVGCHFLLQGIFPTQGSNPDLLHCRQTLLPSEPPPTWWNFIAQWSR